MPLSVGDLAVNVSTNTASLESGFARITDLLNRQSQQWEKTAQGAQTAFSKLDSVVSGLGVSLRALGGLGAVAGFGAVIKSTADYEVSLLRLSQKIGVSVEEFSSLGKAAKNSGTDFETVASLSTKFSKNLATAGEAGNQTTEVLTRLGFKSNELAGLLANPAEGLRLIAQRLNTFRDDGNKAAAAMLLFGKAGADALPFLRQLGDQTVLTATVTTEAAKRAEQFQIALNQLIGQSNALSRSIGESLIPSITGVLEGFAAMNSAGGKSSGFWTYVGEGVRIISLGFATLGTVLKNVIVDVVFFAEAAGKVFSGKFNEVPELFKKRNTDIEANTNALGKFFDKVSEGSPLLAKLGADFVKYQQSLAVRDLAENADHFDRIAIAAKNAGKGVGDFGKASTEAARAADAAAKAVADAEKELNKAQEALDALWQTEDQKVSPAMRKLIDLLVDPAFAKLPEATKDAVREILLEADALEHTASSFERLAKASAEFADQQAKDFAEWQSSVEKNTQSIDALVTRIEDEANSLNLTDQARRRYLATQEIERANNQALFKTQQDYIDALAKVNAAYDKLDASEATKRANDQLVEQVRSLDAAARDAFVNIAENGTNAFKDIGKSIEKYVLEALYKLTLQPFIIQVGASLTGLSTQAVAQALGVSGGSGNLLNIGSSSGSGGIFQSGIGNQFATSSVGQALGLSQSTQLVDSIGGLDTAFTGTTTTLTGFGAALGTAIPIIGTVIAGLSLFSSLFGDKTPSPTRGQFQVTPTTTPASSFEDQRFTASDFGNLGFADAATQYFSGEAAQAFNQIVANALDAFSTRYSPEQSQRLAGILQSTTFAPSTGGSQSTEDFIKQYGGQILRQVVTDAFDVLDAGLANVVSAFQGTDDEFSKFSNTLLGIYDATKDFDAQFRGTIISALEGANQAAADKILAFVGFVSQFGDSIQGLGAQFESVDASNITAFVDALGGAQTAVAAFAFLGQNFTTTAARVNQAQDALNTGFAELGLTLPTSHQAFLDLLSSLDLNTDAGRQTYASLIALAPAFVAVAGTADQAAEALQRQVQSAQQFFDQNFYTQAEQAAQRAANALITISQASTTLGITIPTTAVAFRDLVEQVRATSGADSALYQSLIILAPAINDVDAAAAHFGETAAAAADAITNASNQIIVSVGSLTQQGGGIASAFLQSISGLVSAIDDTSTQYAVKIQLISAEINKLKTSNLDSQVLAGALGPLNQALNQAAADLTQFTVLSAQYGDGIAKQLVALQDWYDEQNQILTGGQSSADITQRLAGLQAQLANAVQYGYDQVTVNFIKGQISALQGTADLLGALDTVFQTKWNAIISGGSAAAESLDDFIKKIQQLADATQGNAGQQAGIELALSSAKISSLQTQYASLDPTSALAKAIAADIARLQVYNAGLATQIGHFVVYTAQYNAATANQLVELENWYAQQQEALAGNTDALAILGDIFNDKWKAIIDGVKAGVDELAKLKVDIAEYLKKLVISDISPLTPTQKLDTSRQSLEAEIALAQGGDLKALGDVTQYLDAFLALDRDFNKSNDQFAADFALYTGQLANIAGVQPSGQPLDSSAAIAAVLPTSGTLASSDDIKTQNALLERLIADLADANTADSIAERKALQEAADEIAAVVGGSQLK